MCGPRDSNKGQTIHFALVLFIANSLHLKCPNPSGLAMQPLKHRLSRDQTDEPEPVWGRGDH